MMGAPSSEMNVVVSGAPASNANGAIDAALEEIWPHVVDRAFDPTAVRYVLVPARTPGDDSYFGMDYVPVPPNATLSDLRVLVGPEGGQVGVKQNGFGGDPFEPFVSWALSDFLPHARAALELYGVVELARVAGRAIRRQRNRQSREVVATWARAGGPVTPALRQLVGSRSSWPPKVIELNLGLSRSEAAFVFAACGYVFNEKLGCYLSPNDLDSVN